MKMIIALASMAFLSTAAFAADTGCNPSQGNWQNAAKKTCPVSDQGHVGDGTTPFYNGNGPAYCEKRA